MNADAKDNLSYGLVLCNLQETVYDNKCILRIYCNLEKLAVVLEKLLLQDEELKQFSSSEKGLNKNTTKNDHNEEGVNKNTTNNDHNEEGVNKNTTKNDHNEEDIFYIPYDAVTGKRLHGNDKLLRLDMREDAAVKLTSGQFEGDEGEVVGKQLEGHYKIRFKHALKPGARLKMLFERVLGTWWVEQAVRGLVDQIPVVNV